MVRAVLIVLGVLCAMIVIVFAVGYLLPVSHVAARTASLGSPPDRVYATLADVEHHTGWRSDVKSVEVLSNAPVKRWREHGSNGAITFEVVETQPPTRLVSRIADADLAFGGTWTYELTPQGSGTQLTITERGDVYNPLFRFMSRFIFGHTATMERFLGDLKKHVG